MLLLLLLLLFYFCCCCQVFALVYRAILSSFYSFLCQSLASILALVCLLLSHSSCAFTCSCSCLYPCSCLSVDLVLLHSFPGSCSISLSLLLFFLLSYCHFILMVASIVFVLISYSFLSLSRFCFYSSFWSMFLS